MSLTRRELLGLLIGAPLAAEACRRPRRSYPGEVVGARVDMGHRLLGVTIENVSVPPVHVPVLIVGAGPSGLSAARQLDRAGHRDYRILELEPRAGGTSAYGTSGVVAHPWGAHYIPLPAPDQTDLLDLLEEAGGVERLGDGRVVAKESSLVRAPEERVFVDGRWYEGLFPSARATPEDRAELARFERDMQGYARFRDSRGQPAFTLPMRRSSDDAELRELDRISAARWLDQRGYRSKLVRWYLEYACRDDYGSRLEETSAWALLFYFASRVHASNGEPAPFLTWPEGNGRLVAHLQNQVGDRLLLNRLVTEIVPGDQGVEVLAYETSSQRFERYRADDVILAVPKLVARRIVRPYREQPPAHLAEFEYSAWLVANLHLSRRPRSVGFPFAWDNVLFDSPSLGYVVASHQTLSDFGPTVWTYYRPFSELDEKRARQLLYELDHATAVDGILTDLSRAHRGLEDALERVDVMRWGHAMVKPTPGFVWGAARARAHEPLGRVVFAHSDLSGIALFEEAFDRGVLASNAVIRRRRLI